LTTDLISANLQFWKYCLPQQASVGSKNIIILSSKALQNTMVQRWFIYGAFLLFTLIVTFVGAVLVVPQGFEIQREWNSVQA
jgi:hypothetical protein